MGFCKNFEYFFVIHDSLATDLPMFTERVSLGVSVRLFVFPNQAAVGSFGASGSSKTFPDVPHKFRVSGCKQNRGETFHGELVKSTSPDTENHDKNGYVKLYDDKNTFMTNVDNDNSGTTYTDKHMRNM